MDMEVTPRILRLSVKRFRILSGRQAGSWRALKGSKSVKVDESSWPSAGKVGGDSAPSTAVLGEMDGHPW